TAFLKEAGIEVLRARALGLAGSDAFCSAPAGLFEQATLDARHPDADGYFISCTNIRAIETVAALEPALGRPVITSNQATLWYCLRRLGLPDAPAGLGTLFNHGVALPLMR
ncbi:MAG: arylmalonate decarboxylase, partial [Chloroflexota bacterium]